MHCCTCTNALLLCKNAFCYAKMHFVDAKCHFALAKMHCAMQNGISKSTSDINSNAATESAMLARKAQNTLASLTSKERSNILNEIANSIENEMKAILSANARDVVLFDRPAVGEMGADEIVCTDTHSITNIIFLNILNTIICIYLTNLLFRKPCNYNRYH